MSSRSMLFMFSHEILYAAFVRNSFNTINTNKNALPPQIFVFSSMACLENLPKFLKKLSLYLKCEFLLSWNSNVVLIPKNIYHLFFPPPCPRLCNAVRAPFSRALYWTDILLDLSLLHSIYIPPGGDSASSIIGPQLVRILKGEAPSPPRSQKHIK